MNAPATPTSWRDRLSTALALAGLREGDELLQLADVPIQAADLLVKKVVITDTFDNVTEMTFDTLELNPKVDDGQFVYQPADGVDVIKAN